ncbi:MAG: hypothetical protein U0176_12615 [Bacteroidia bacterium]
MNNVPASEKEELIAKWLANPVAKAWLDQFQPADVPGFLEKYYDARTFWITYGKKRAKDREYWLTADQSLAEMVLFYIQQKKLWDLQVQWRAGSAVVPDVRHCGDWEMLEMRIRNLDFLPPITAEEVEILKDWLLDYKLCPSVYFQTPWQKYGYYVDDNMPGDIATMPSLYDYWDMRHKIVPLWRVLPDLRSTKEWNYAYAARKVAYAKLQAENPTPPHPVPVYDENDKRPWLTIYGEHTNEFVKIVDDHKVLECKLALEQHNRMEDDHELKNAIEKLQNAQEPVSIDANDDWREGVIRAAWKYERTRLVKALDVAFQNYQFNRNLGIAYPEPDPKRTEYLRQQLEYMAEEILDGRELMGEPRNFDF